MCYVLYSKTAFTCTSWYAGLAIVTDTVANATKIFSLVTKNSGLVATLAIRCLYNILDLH